MVPSLEDGAADSGRACAECRAALRTDYQPLVPQEVVRTQEHIWREREQVRISKLSKYLIVRLQRYPRHKAAPTLADRESLIKCERAVTDLHTLDMSRWCPDGKQYRVYAAVVRFEPAM